MNMIADLATPSLLYLLSLFALVFFRFSSEITEGKPWYRMPSHSYFVWDEDPYKWFNMLARGLTGFYIVFCALGWYKVAMTYQYGQPLQYHFGLVFKWALLAGVLDVIYCVVYNIWFRYNQPRFVVIERAGGWKSVALIHSTERSDQNPRRQKRRLSRAHRKANKFLNSPHGTRGNKDTGNPRYRHLY